MTPPAFAWRSLTRQPARTVLGLLGIAIVGALLFDMLLLSRGLSASFRELLDGVGFDVRVTAGPWVPSERAPLREATDVARTLRDLPEIEAVVAVRFGKAEFAVGEAWEEGDFMAVTGDARSNWTLLEGEPLPASLGAGPPSILLNRTAATRLAAAPGDSLRVRGRCDPDRSLPAIEFVVSGIVEMQFEAAGSSSSVTTIEPWLLACRPEIADAATLLLVASDPRFDADDAVAAARRAFPSLHVYSNREFVEQMQRRDFSYFRQISFALSTITLFFAFLLIATLLTVSTNQRLGEIAALRALGFSRRWIVVDLLLESTILVVVGGVAALPLGLLMARWLDGILRQMPGIPVKLHFFVFQPQAAWSYLLLMTAVSLLATIYPVLLAARLPIAATLRRETVS